VFAERLKADLSEMKTKMLDINCAESVTHENFKTMCEAITNIQSLLTEMITELQCQQPVASKLLCETSTVPLDAQHS